MLSLRFLRSTLGLSMTPVAVRSSSARTQKSSPRTRISALTMRTGSLAVGSSRLMDRNCQLNA